MHGDTRDGKFIHAGLAEDGTERAWVAAPIAEWGAEHFPLVPGGAQSEGGAAESKRPVARLVGALTMMVETSALISDAAARALVRRAV
jgi:hypothetical protein